MKNEIKLMDGEYLVQEVFLSSVKSNNQSSRFILPILIFFIVNAVVSAYAYMNITNMLFFGYSLFCIIVVIILFIFYINSKNNDLLKKDKYLLTNLRLIYIRDEKIIKEKFLNKIKTIEMEKVTGNISNIIIDKEENWASQTVKYTSMDSFSSNEYASNTFVLWHIENPELIVNKIKSIN